MTKAWESVIGLEVHVQLLTQSKLFSDAPTAYGAAPNTQACVVDLAMPGVLPVLNKAAVEMAIKFGLSVGADIGNPSVFARKNYFYPDLPKGYQISQFDLPIVKGGSLNILLEDGEHKTIGITRAHLEEDAGKSLHDALPGTSGIDLNRAGTPLLEIVSEPEIRSAKEAIAYLKTLHALVCYLGICDGNMQEGSFRCDANVSVRPQGQAAFGTRVEIKNVNSFRFVEKAINYEIARQIDVIENGGEIAQETRLYDADRNETRSMRSKEDAQDYRYFPDPDLLPVVVDSAFIEKIRRNLPELPTQKIQRFQQHYGINEYDATLLTSTKEMADFYETVIKKLADTSEQATKLAANWMLGELSAALNRHNLDIQHSPLQAAQLALLLQRILDGTLSNNIAKKVFETMWQTGESVDVIIEKQGLRQINDDTAIVAVIDKVMAEFPQQLADYRAGKDKLFGFFVGQVMKIMGGKANPQQLNALLKEKLQ